MSGSVDAVSGVVLGPLAEESGPAEAPPREPAADEAEDPASRTLRKFSQLTFAYGVSAVFASGSAILMGVPGGGVSLVIAALGPFVVSVVISGYVLTDILEVLWDGFAGRSPGSEGLRGWLWGATLLLLLVGMVAFVAGIALTVLAYGARPDYAYLAPAGVASLAVCGLSILTAVVLPSIALGPPTGRWVATMAFALGGFAVTMEALVAFNPPFGSDPLLGWMEGTFPLLNWNFGFGALVAASAFLVWASYRFLLPDERTAAVPV